MKKLQFRIIALKLPSLWSNPADDGLISDHEFIEAIHALEGNDSCLYITGRAGTGKSSLLKYWKNNTRKQHVILSSTGTSAWDLDRSSTVHSFFNFQPKDTVQDALWKTHESQQANKYRIIDTIVIDEVSMIRADFMDQIDEFLRDIRQNDLPFGGIQMIFFGDNTQLGPVIDNRSKKAFYKKGYSSTHHFDAHVFKGSIKQTSVELKTVRRQNNRDLINKLNIIRERKLSTKRQDLQALNTGFQFQTNDTIDLNSTVFLTTRNDTVQKLNNKMLDQLSGKKLSIKATFTGKIGNATDLPALKTLDLKIGAKIMLTTNDSNKQWVNGSIGTIVSIREGNDYIRDIQVQLDSGETVNVERYTWYHYEDKYNASTNRNEKHIAGEYSQFPLKLAYAMTVHKAQGKSFDRVHVDLSQGFFAPGQLYTALSRSRTIEGLTLSRPVQYKDIKVDQHVMDFLFWQNNSPDDFMDPALGIAIYQNITDCINNKKWIQLGHIPAEGNPKEIMIRPLYLTEGIDQNGNSYPKLIAETMPGKSGEAITETAFNLLDFIDPIRFPKKHLAQTLQHAISENRWVHIKYRKQGGAIVTVKILPTHIGEFNPAGHNRYIGIRAEAPELTKGTMKSSIVFNFNNLLSVRFD